ncbi:MAG: hypothetical protein Q8M93_07380 [Polaromonas sp.]|uniref:hypothetical protein n=1 Tax=Comamonadaceae TaxID=80864 RepID=UPI002736D6B6|nr:MULTISPECIES: hypothetical protein [Comamonadaceae]MDP3246769.1 hypothetical protein [Polaromonas sp.]MDP3336547.1 hypothetical protein [Rhodoferax sp.]
MTDDTRCCGTGTCLIDVQGRCWCGQQWDGEQMCRPSSEGGKPDAASTDHDHGAPAVDAD